MNSDLAWMGLSYPFLAYFKYGTELAVAYVPGTKKRFSVVEICGPRDSTGSLTKFYALRDGDLTITGFNCPHEALLEARFRASQNVA